MKGGPAINIFEEEYEKRFGIVPMSQTPDAIQLNRALKATGDDYRELVAFYLSREDRFLESHGYSGRMLTAPVINMFRLNRARSASRVPAASNDYKKKMEAWAIENEIVNAPVLPPLSPLTDSK